MGVTVVLGNGGLGGTVQTTDGVMGLVMTGFTEGDYTVGDVIMITGMASLATAGITATGNAFAYKQVKEFYDEAGDGARLYLMLVNDLVTVAMMALNTNANGVKKLLDYGDGKIKVVGLLTNDPILDEAPTVEAGMNIDCYEAADNLQLTLEGYAAKEQPMRGIIGCSSYTGVAADLVDQTENSDNRVSMLIGDSASGAGAAVGLLLGRCAGIPVEQKISWVGAGKLAMQQAYLGTTAVNSNTADSNIIRSLGYITLIAYARKAGFFFRGDAMATSTTDDYSSLARGRVIDKAHVIAYLTYLDEVDGKVPLNADGSGTMKTTFRTWLENQIVKAIDYTMGVAKQISAVRCFIDPDQNIAVSESVEIVVGIIPVGYTSEIIIKLGFAAG